MKNTKSSMRKLVRSEKCKDLLLRVRSHLENGDYLLTQHALKRKTQRGLTLPAVLYVLKNGYHEKVKDSWDEQFRIWKYSIRGKTFNDDEARVIVSFDQSGMLIITVIRLDKRE